MSSASAERRVEDLRPRTLDHFRYWASLTTLDNGSSWELEPFECDIVADVFEGYREVLAVLPTGSGKTTLFGGFGLYHMQFTPSAKVPVGAASKHQAAILYEQAMGFVLRSRFLLRRFKVQDGYKRIVGMRWTPLEGRWMRVYSASDDTGDGIIPSLALIDELHRHKGHDLYGTWRDKLIKMGGGQMVTLSTAGDREDNPLEELRDAAHRLAEGQISVEGRHTRVASKGSEFCMHEWALRRDDDHDDLEIVKQANPASWVTLEELRMRRDSPSTKLHQWKRFTCNLRAAGEDSAITPEDFDTYREDGLAIPDDVPVYLGLDLGWKIDHAGITPLGWVSARRRLIANPVTIAPPVEENAIVQAILLFCEELDVQAVVYDPSAGGEQMVQQLEKGTHELQTSDDARLAAGLRPLKDCKTGPLRFAAYSQDNAPMALAAVRFDEAFRSGWIRHDGASKCATPGCRCGGFRGHVINAAERTLSEKWKYDRPSDARGAKRARFPIDGLTAALFANAVAVGELGAGLTPFSAGDYRIERL